MGKGRKGRRKGGNVNPFAQRKRDNKVSLKINKFCKVMDQLTQCVFIQLLN